MASMNSPGENPVNKNVSRNNQALKYRYNNPNSTGLANHLCSGSLY